MFDTQDIASEDENRDLFVRHNVKMLDNQLIRKIEAHLAGLPRASEEFGIDT